MAEPIDYFTPEELAALRQNATRGIGAAQRSVAPDNPTAQSISEQYAQKKAALAAQRLGISPAPTPTPTPTPTVAAPSAPVGETVAPVATAEAASKPSLGQRILNARGTVSNALNLASRGLGGLQAAKGGYEAVTEAPTGNTFLGVPLPSAETVNNITQGAASIVAPGIGFAGNLLTAARDAALEHILGYKGEGQNIAGPELKKQIAAAGGGEAGLTKLLAQQQEARRAASIPIAQTRPHTLSEIPEGVPPSGTGFIKNETTGRVTPVGSPSTQQYVRRQIPVEVGGSTPASLQSSQSGGIFSTLIGPTLERAQQHAFGTGPGTAAESQAYKRTHAQQAQDIESAYKQGEIGVQNRQAGAHELQALAALKSASVKENPNKVVQDVLGNPIIVNPATGEARKPNVKTTPSVDDFMKEARKVNKGATDEQLKAYYNQKYGG